MQLVRISLNKINQLRELTSVVTAKKVFYVLFSASLSLLVIYFSNRIVSNDDLRLFVFRAVVFCLCFGALAAFVVRVFIPKSMSFSYFFIMFLHVVIGFSATLHFFPNLGVLIKLFAYLGLLFAIYVLFLIHNIFIVMEEKGSVIPLYSVALGWVQIIIVALAIPFFTSVYKIPSGVLLQFLGIAASTSLLSIYLIWTLTFDKNIKQTSIVEKGVMVLFSTFCVSALSLATSFMPAEAFIRGLFVASVLMFGLAYIQAHYKNRVNRKMLAENLGLIVVLFFIMLVFSP